MNVQVKLKNQTLEAKDPDALISPSSSDPTKQEALEIISFFLDFITTKSDFTFWFVLFKEFYLYVFYPKIFQEMGGLSKTDGIVL